MTAPATHPIPTAYSLFSMGFLTIVAIILLSGVGLIVRHYPVSGWWLTLGLTGYAILLWRYPGLWLAILPIALCILDLAPWTGWFFIEETDFLLVITLVVGYLQLARVPPVRRLAQPAGLILTLYALALIVSLIRGLSPLSSPDFSALASYDSPYNSLRVAKGVLWALLLLPLLRRSLTVENRDRYLLPGLLLGLAGIALVVIIERASFPGLMDFASDYRATGPFSATHTGGAALDGALALLMPFSFWWLFQATRPLAIAWAVALLGIGVYAVMATFSRGLYLGFAASVIVMGLGLLLNGPHDKRWRLLLALVPLMLLSAYLLSQVFSTGGYRTLTAAILLLIGAVFIATAQRPLPKAALIGWAIGITAGSELLLWSLFPKGVYVGFTLAALACAAGILLVMLKRRETGVALGIAGVLGMAIGTALVAQHWGGQPALHNALPAIGLSFGLIAVNAQTRLWRWGRSTLISIGFLAVVLGISIPVVGNYQMGERFSQVQQNWQERMHHWRSSLRMMDNDGLTALFGMGIGKFPVTYFWKNPTGEFPGSLRYETEGDNTFLRLGGPRHPRGYGEALRVGQRVDVPANTVLYTLSLRARSPAGNAELEVALCQKWLLYPFNCSGRALRISNPDWRNFEVVLKTDQFAFGPWYAYRPIQLNLANTSQGVLDIDNIRLQPPAAGADLIANGDFSQGNARWFFTSDRHHLPWHAKNIGLNLLFDQGWIGLMLFGLLTFLGLLAALRQARRGDRLALAALAGLLGFLLVGLFDSLLDVPRLALLYLLVLFGALLEPGPPMPSTNHSRVQAAT
ncbi:MAG: hypothetical protein JNK95_02445 [Candidatus Competibacter sp.]|nr:hypothetical protein [Candidatus Competibacter sp.]MDG4607089.1 hypothetical protein [Candidatus Contendobacter sp.]HRD48090.1 hypothetical protein [Candidatus Contendobacter sp.]